VIQPRGLSDVFALALQVPELSGLTDASKTGFCPSRLGADGIHALAHSVSTWAVSNLIYRGNNAQKVRIAEIF
jgi:hypothetical protein